jgi:hypothetical protein
LPEVLVQWSKLRKQLDCLRAPTLADRIGLHQARYRYSKEELGRLWITLDGREIASFDTAPYARRREELSAQLFKIRRDELGGAAPGHAAFLEADRRAEELLRQDGRYDDYRAKADLESYLSMSLDEALVSPSPLHRGLAMIDRRLGKRRLQALGPSVQHPLVRALYNVRCEAEGLSQHGSAF